MTHWLLHAFQTYALHPLHGNGYQWWSGLGSGSAWLAGLSMAWHRHNCHIRGCWRVVRHGKTVCVKHENPSTTHTDQSGHLS